MFLVTLLSGLVAFEFLGYAVHRLMHARWSGPIFRAHMTHHSLYGRESTSDVYRRAGAHSAVRYYAAAALPLVVAMFLLLPLGHAGALAAELAAFAWINDYFHDAAHVRGHWLSSFGWFRRLSAAHLVHHRDARRNYGLLTLAPDRVLGTYRAARLGK